MNWDREQATKAFREEAYELLSDLEAALLDLERSPEDKELIGRVFRVMHTLKGTGSMFGFDEIATAVHEAEAVFELIRSGRLHLSKDIIDQSLTLRDAILAELDQAREGDKESISKLKSVGGAFSELMVEAGQTADEAGPDAKTIEEPATYRIRFRPPRDILLTGTDPLDLLNELRQLGRCTVLARTGDIPPLNDIEPELCYMYWDIVLSTTSPKQDVEDVFMFVEHDSDLDIEAIHVGAELNTEEAHAEIATLLSLSEDVATVDLCDSLVDRGFLSREASCPTVHGQDAAVKGLGACDVSNIRVPSDKLDRLVDLVGEMVTVQARLSQAAGSNGDAEIAAISEEVEQLTEELRDSTMSLRMVPIGATFRRFGRLVRDLASELGKEVELVTEGEETELDKKMIEKISDPLVHIVRNAVSHGIESPKDRLAAGKSGAGTVRLSASHTGPYMHIEISDDGAGLDAEAIRRSAVERGLIAPDADVADKDIFSLIFLPGFSTAEGVSSVSGRGVGLDVVKMQVESLKGMVEVESEAGKGTRFMLRLPLTLAIIDGLLVKLGDERFVMPLSTVEECVELQSQETTRDKGRRLLNLRGQIVPYIRLRENFNILGDPPALEQAVVVNDERGRAGIVVDNVVGELQTVIKPLGRFYNDIEGVSGATILGDGKVALILDVPKLMQSAIADEQRSFVINRSGNGGNG